MPPKSRQQAGTKKVRRKEKNVAHGHAHIKSTFNNTIMSITDPTGNVIAWASAGQVGFKGRVSRRPTRRRWLRRRLPGARRSTACARSMSTSRVLAPAARPRSDRSRPSASRSVRSRTSHRCRTTAAARRSGGACERGTSERRPPHVTAATSSLSRKKESEKEHGSIHRPGLQAVPPGRPKLFLKGAKCESPKCPIEIRPYPPGEHGRGRTKDSEYLLQMRETKCAHLRRARKQFRGYYEGEPPVRQDRREPAADPRDPPRQRRLPRRFCEEPGHGQAAGAPRSHPVNGAKVDIPSYRVSETDIIEVRPSSHELTPFIVARAEAGERPVPAWLEVLPNKMRILVHGTPARGAIDTPIQEQLIVELYSK